MSYIGNQISVLETLAAPLYSFTFQTNGTQTNFTLPVQVYTAAGTQVYNNGIYQEKSTYSIIGNLLAFEVAPETGFIEIQVIAIQESVAQQTVDREDYGLITEQIN